MEAVEKVASAILYEGYHLWPDQRSAIKKQKRLTMSGVYPRIFSETARNGDPWKMQTQCLVCGENPSVAVKLNFLQSVERKVGTRNATGGLDFVEALQASPEHCFTWGEAREQKWGIDLIPLSELARPKRFTFSISQGTYEESLASPACEVDGALLRVWQSLEGEVELAAERVREGTFLFTVRISNLTSWKGGDREKAIKYAFLSAHTILQVDGGEFVSLTDPPEQFQESAKQCLNLHTWPVLAGETGSSRYILSSPIILPDYPQVVPESMGDLLDTTGIDQLLFLNILSFPEDEGQELHATDLKARAILERTAAQPVDGYLKTYATNREVHSLGESSDVPAIFQTMEAPVRECLVIDGSEIRKGSKVRLQPRSGGVIWDTALEGKIAFIETIEQDYDGRVHLAVTLEDDPPKETDEERLIGHRFFFSPEEVVPFAEEKGFR